MFTNKSWQYQAAKAGAAGGAISTRPLLPSATPPLQRRVTDGGSMVIFAGPCQENFASSIHGGAGGSNPSGGSMMNTLFNVLASNGTYA